MWPRGARMVRACACSNFTAEPLVQRNHQLLRWARKFRPMIKAFLPARQPISPDIRGEIVLARLRRTGARVGRPNAAALGPHTFRRGAARVEQFPSY